MPLKRMTLIGTETYLNQKETPQSISDNWSLDNESYDKDTLIANIVMTGGRFEPVYSNPDYFSFMSGLWWNKWRRTFEKWFDAFDLEYNPLENYDRQESWHEDTNDGELTNVGYGSTTTLDHDGSHVVGGTDTTVVDDDTTYTKSGDSTDTNDVDTESQESGTTQSVTDQDQTLRAPGTSGSNGLITEHQLSAYDSSSYSPQSKDVTSTNRSEDSTNDTTETVTHGKKVVGKEDSTKEGVWSESGSGTGDSTTTKTWSETGTDNADDTTAVEGTSATDRSYDRDLDHEGRIHGNIGVTTSQQMLQAELDVQAWNIYQHITDIFCKEMLITVY